MPASALAAGETLIVSPTSTQAGSGTNVTAKLTFDAADTPKTVVTSLAPGMLGNLNANPTCLVGSPQHTPSCQIGTEVTHTNAPAPANNIPGNLYLVPPQGTDAAGIDAVPAPPSLPSQYIGITLNPKAAGSLNLTTTFPQPQAPGRITGFDTTFTTLGNQPFTRLPSSCSAATSSFSASYYGAAAPGSGSGSFTPTGCSTLAYSPNMTATITRDKSGSGATVVTSIAQGASESASKSIVLSLPKGLTPNVTAVGSCLVPGSAGCKIGTATATSPLVPSPALSNGSVILGGTIAAPTLSITFPAPFALTITGNVGLTSNSVTFPNVPDVPLTSLALNITGPNGQKAFNTDCKPANVSGQFTAQSGATHNSSAPVKFVGCALKPTASASTSGLASGHPKLKFKVTHGKGAPKVATVAVGLPAGLKFSRSAIVSHKTCTTKGKTKKCTTTTLIKGLGIAGGKAKSVAIKRGKLVITLKKPAGTVSITASGRLVTESKSLRNKVKSHKTKRLKFTLKVTDAKKTATTLSLKPKAH